MFATRPKKHLGQRQHAKQRVNERTGISLRTKELKHLIRNIQSGDESKARHMATQSNFRTLWRVLHVSLGVWFNVVYDKKRGSIATFLTDDMVKETFGDDAFRKGTEPPQGH